MRSFVAVSSGGNGRAPCALALAASLIVGACDCEEKPVAVARAVTPMAVEKPAPAAQTPIAPAPAVAPAPETVGDAGVAAALGGLALADAGSLAEASAADAGSPVDTSPPSVAEARGCATAQAASPPTQADALALLAQPAAQRIATVRGWGCLHAEATGKLLTALQGAQARSADAVHILCGLPWAQALDWRDDHPWQKRFKCPECPSNECEPECDCKAPNEEKGRHNDRVCLLAYALDHAFFTSAMLPAEIDACKVQANASAGDWDQAVRERQKARDQELIQLLRAGPLDEARWQKLALAVADLHYADEPHASPSGETLRRAKLSLARDSEPLTPVEAKALRAAFAAEGASESEPPNTTLLAFAGSAGKVARLCAWDADHKKRRQGLFVLSEGAVRALDGPRDEALDHNALLMGNHVCDALLDLIDVDGDGEAELVVRRYTGQDNHLREELEILTLRGPQRRFHGLGQDHDTTQW